MQLDNILELNHIQNTFNLLISSIIGKLIKQGKKAYSVKLLNELQYCLKKNTKKNPNFLILVAVFNSLLKIHFIKIRLGGSRKEIPVTLAFNRQVKFAITEMLYHVKTKRGKSIDIKKLVNLICFCYKGSGPLIKRNFLLYKKAMDNKILLNFIKK
jgi:ribosomal protein S7